MGSLTLQPIRHSEHQIVPKAFEREFDALSAASRESGSGRKRTPLCPGSSLRGDIHDRSPVSQATASLFGEQADQSRACCGASGGVAIAS